MMEHLCRNREVEKIHAILTSDSTTMQDDLPGAPKGGKDRAASEAIKPRITAELETAHSSVTVSAVACGWMGDNMEGIKKELDARHETVETTNARCVLGWSGNDHSGNTKTRASGFRGGVPNWKDGAREQAQLTGAMLSRLPRLPVIFGCWCGDTWHYVNNGPGTAAPRATMLGEDMINNIMLPSGTLVLNMVEVYKTIERDGSDFWHFAKNAPAQSRIAKVVNWSSFSAHFTELLIAIYDSDEWSCTTYELDDWWKTLHMR